MWFMPELLCRAGFTVDVVTCSDLMQHSRFVERVDRVSCQPALIQLAKSRAHDDYDWIIPTEDGLLGSIASADLSPQTKLKLLPVVSESDFHHLHSKIGLSRSFSRAGIQTPPFQVATSMQEACEAAKRLGFPVLLKVDASGGGCGIHELKSDVDVAKVPAEFWERPVLLKKKLSGTVLDLSALFLRTELIHFSYSTMDRVVSNRFGPSSLRTYRPLSRVEQPVFDELTALGKALGADGFCNICCIDAKDGSGRWYVEADMRPNVWIDTPHYFGEELASRISDAFHGGQRLRMPPTHAPVPESASDLQIPYFLRLSPVELLLNRYSVWRYVPTRDLPVLQRVLYRRVRKYTARDLVRDTLRLCNRDGSNPSF
ncbi:MAG: hypothetical protein ACO3Z6_12705 [Pseudomonadales bacterium]